MLLLGCFCLGKMKCVICQIEQAWCFPQRLNKLAMERNGSGGGGAVYLSCYITVLFEEFPNIYMFFFSHWVVGLDTHPVLWLRNSGL